LAQRAQPFTESIHPVADPGRTKTKNRERSYTIRQRMTLAIGACILLISLVSSVLIGTMAASSMKEQYIETGLSIVAGLAEQSLFSVLYNDTEQARVSMQTVLGFPGVNETAIYDARGTEIFSLGERKEVLDRNAWFRQAKRIDSVRSSLIHETVSGWHFIAPILKTEVNDLHSVSRNTGREIVGYAYIVIDNSTVNNARHTIIAGTVLIISILGIAMLITINMLLGTLVKPVSDISDIMEEAQKLKWNHLRAPISGPREAKTIALAFNRLMDVLVAREDVLMSQKSLLIQKLEDQARIESKLKENRNFLDGVVNSVFDMIIITDNYGIIIQSNRSIEMILGYSPESVVNKSISALIPDLREQGAIERFTQAGLAEVLGHHADGSKVQLSIHAQKLASEHHTVYVYTLRDITQQQQYESQLARTAAELANYADALKNKNTELDNFAYVASHDLKAPLRAISNLSTWIEEDLGEIENPEIKEHLKLLRSRVIRMEDLINGILQYSRAGRISAELSPTDTSDMIHGIMDMLGVDDRFTIKISPHMPSFDCARTPLAQVFSNLISNAIKYHDKDNGTIEINVHDRDSEYEFVVCDDGPGIDPQYHEVIFGIFQTLHSRDEIESTGIGLAVVKKIIADQKGKIWLNSEPGKGTCFHFTWPKITMPVQS